ncbi:MAG: hypothetical protein HKO90_04675 [Flavobacteriaceae bacterium]|nr:hypothetical protein [Bacteroidia bacterium]NNK87555.1 hypothetical protein [Flavobacteriaceae bacterium]
MFVQWCYVDRVDDNNYSWIVHNGCAQACPQFLEKYFKGQDLVEIEMSAIQPGMYFY